MVIIDKERCIGCGSCISDCFSGHIRLVDGKAETVGEKCLLCGHCVALCPANAVSIPEYGSEDIESFDRSRIVSPDAMLYTIKARRSFRRFKERKVETEVVEQLIQAGRYTATAKNLQGNTFVFVQEKLDEFISLTWSEVENSPASDEFMRFYAVMNRKRLSGGGDTLFRNAPMLLLVANERSLDGGLAAQNMENMAFSMGLGMQYNGFLCRLVNYSDALKKWLGIEGKTVQACMLVGYPDIEYLRTVPRRKADVILK